jgi:hypothetical protein
MSSSGRYLYCVLEAGSRPPLEGVGGVDPQAGVHVLDHAGVSAVVSAVSLAEFGAEPLARNLEDLAWLERTARAHQAVLDRALAAGAVVPLRLCTIFADDAQLRRALERNRAIFLEALERVRGRAEWSVKAFADPAALAAAALERSPALAGASGEAPGRAYLARKQRDRRLRDEARALAESAAEEIHRRLCEQATAATLLPAQHPDLAPRGGEMVLNGAYLVERAGAAGFAALAGELADRHRELGLSLELSGPWAPYNFVAAVGSEP